MCGNPIEMKIPTGTGRMGFIWF